MGFLASEDILKHISGIIHENTQRHEGHIDLTVAEIYRITGAGSLDFGGSEFKPATLEKLNPEKQRSGDNYGWWKLGRGPYKILFNESVDLPKGATGVIVPHHHARKAGLVANSLLISSGEDADDLFMNVTVSEAGCNIKENARIAKLWISG
jgi:hypothetical protein